MKLTESQVLFTAENHDNLPAQPGRSALELIKTGAPTRFERATSGLGIHCSILLSYGGIIYGMTL